MNDNTLTKLIRSFNEIVQKIPNSNEEFWYARDLMKKLEYTGWRNFLKVLAKAKKATINSNVRIKNHFVDVNKMVQIGSGAKRQIDDIMLSRYACYLIAQNGDPRKEAIAFAQTYFAVQTRKQEVIEERIRLQERLQARKKLTESETELSKNIYERGVDDKGFGRIRSHGDTALFGGNSTAQMKDKMGTPQNRPLADFLPTVTIAAKNLATEITNHNVSQNDLQGESAITSEHVQNNSSVRNMLGERGIKPENLSPEKDLKKLERQAKSAEKKLSGGNALPEGSEVNE
ncbi:DNA damage-inducible protein D [bacterium]|nr:DNA damage-inducible protein D [Candidatus Neomarinimicrobiota bacterium]MCK5681456.1 DNA damage-inducible protein D [bacterium]